MRTSLTASHRRSYTLPACHCWGTGPVLLRRAAHLVAEPVQDERQHLAQVLLEGLLHGQRQVPEQREVALPHKGVLAGGGRKQLRQQLRQVLLAQH
jgi:hypothetical protein